MPLHDRHGFTIMNMQTAKKQAIEHIKNNKGADQLDVAQALNIGLEYACHVCKILIAEKRIEMDHTMEKRNNSRCGLTWTKAPGRGPGDCSFESSQRDQR